MSVTQESFARADAQLDPQTAASVDLAVAQWLRSARATSTARERLLALGVAPEEIERRRRCDSGDRSLADLLRLAVTIVIARGRLEARDLQRPRPTPDDARVRSIAHAVAKAFYSVTIAESVDRTPYAAIDMEIGDY